MEKTNGGKQGFYIMSENVTLPDAKRDIQLYLSDSSIATLKAEAHRAQLSSSALVRVISRILKEERYQEQLRLRIDEIILEESRRV